MSHLYWYVAIASGLFIVIVVMMCTSDWMFDKIYGDDNEDE